MQKAFSLVLADLNDGSTAAGLTADLHELLAAVQHSGRSGSLTVKLKIAPATKGSTMGVDKVTIVAEKKLELPKPDAPTDFFWLTDDAELSRKHPRQNELELRHVEGSGVVSSNDLKKAS